MAKKNVISDFGSLKGKIVFSESKPVVEKSTKQENSRPAESQTEDKVLKVGQKVVMMDSDFRGTIVTLGKTVGIELEDGLRIQAAYGEFAVTEDHEIHALKHSKVKTKHTSAPSRKISVAPSSSTLSVDLHIEAIPGGRNVPKGQQLQFQMNTFRRVVRENVSHRGMKINFIHGVGDGILKSAIRKELDEVLALRCSYSVGDPAVTVVTIR